MAEETQAGGVILDKLEILSSADKDPADLRLTYQELHLYEDMYSNYITGSVLIADTFNLPYNYAIVGHEELTVRFKGTNPYAIPNVNTKFVDLKFFVHGITDRAITGEKEQVYALSFTSHAALRNNLTKVSQAFKGSIPQIIDSLSRQYLQEGVAIAVNSPTAFQCVIPYWPPVMAINWLAERCITTTSTADCLFYQNREAMVLASLSTLKAQNPRLLDAGGSTFYFQPQGTGNPDRPTLQRTVENVSVNGSFNTLDLAQEGTYGSQVVSHDITRKKLTYHPKFSYDKNFTSRPQLEAYRMTPRAGVSGSSQIGNLSHHSNAGYRFQPKSAHLFGDATNSQVHVQSPESWVAQRKSELNQTKMLRVGVLLAGDTSMRLGEVVSFKEFPTQQPSYPGIVQPKDEFLSGNFLITAIHHMVSKGEYKMMIELTKDSLGKMIK